MGYPKERKIDINEIEESAEPETNVIGGEAQEIIVALRLQLREQQEKIATLERNLEKAEEKHETRLSQIIKENKLLRRDIAKYEILQEKIAWFFV